jgi:hypothetical protein
MRQLLRTTATVFVALVFTAGMAFGQDNESHISQVGSNIEATVNQDGSDNYSDLDQSEDFTGGHSATIEQIGENNYSNIQTQNGGGTANVYMKGDNNELVDWKTRERGGFGANQKNGLNVFDLDITGDNNSVGMTQEFGDAATVDLNGDNNTLGLRQLSNANYQEEDFHTASITVNGSDNQLTVNQAGPNGGTGGTGNSATVTLESASDFNTVNVVQRGSMHTSTVTVNGSNNTASVTQEN